MKAELSVADSVVPCQMLHPPGPVYSRLCLTCQCGKRRKQCSPPSFASDWQLWASFGLLKLLCAVPESWDSHKHHLTGWLSQFTAAFHHQNFAKQPLGLGHYFKALYEDRALSCTDLGHTSIPKKGTAPGRLMHQPRTLICKCLAVTFFRCKMGEQFLECLQHAAHLYFTKQGEIYFQLEI